MTSFYEDQVWYVGQCMKLLVLLGLLFWRVTIRFISSDRCWTFLNEELVFFLVSFVVGDSGRKEPVYDPVRPNVMMSSVLRKSFIVAFSEKHSEGFKGHQIKGHLIAIFNTTFEM
jgi:hypothetical protein